MTVHRGAPLPFDAIVIAGGRGSRLGGVDKPGLRIDGVSLVERAVSSAVAARRVCVVGVERPVSRTVVWAIEEPRGGGPAAALGAGIRALSSEAAPVVLVLASDLARPAEAVSALLAHGIPGATHGLVAVDESGRRQPLLALYDTAALAEATAGELVGVPLRRVLASLTLAQLELSDELCADVDTVEDAARLRVTGLPPLVDPSRRRPETPVT